MGLIIFFFFFFPSALINITFSLHRQRTSVRCNRLCWQRALPEPPDEMSFRLQLYIN